MVTSIAWKTNIVYESSQLLQFLPGADSYSRTNSSRRHRSFLVLHRNKQVVCWAFVHVDSENPVSIPGQDTKLTLLVRIYRDRSIIFPRCVITRPVDYLVHPALIRISDFVVAVNYVRARTDVALTSTVGAKSGTLVSITLYTDTMVPRIIETE